MYVPDNANLHLRVLQYHHNHILAEHLGQNKTLELIRRHYTWPNICDDVQKFCKSCIICMRSKPQRHRLYESLQQLPIPERPWNSISMDFIKKCKKAKLQAGIKPTALCSAIDKENSIESLLDFATLYIQLLSWLCILSSTVLMPVSWLLCHMLWLWLWLCVMWPFCDFVTPLWLCDCHVIFPTLHLSNNLKEKKRKRKGI